MDAAAWARAERGGFSPGEDIRPNAARLCACEPGVVLFETRAGGARHRCARCGRGRREPSDVRPAAAELERLSAGDLDRLGELLRSTAAGARILRRLNLPTWRGTPPRRASP